MIIGRVLPSIFLVALIAPVAAQQPPMRLKVGDPAPDFALRDQTGKLVKLSDFRGKKNVVLAFYILAFTSG